jgi:hypothetical protein
MAVLGLQDFWWRSKSVKKLPLVGKPWETAVKRLPMHGTGYASPETPVSLWVIAVERAEIFAVCGLVLRS